MPDLYRNPKVAEAHIARCKDILGENWLLHEKNKVQRRTPTTPSTGPEHRRAGYEDCVRRAAAYMVERGYHRLSVEIQEHLNAHRP